MTRPVEDFYSFLAPSKQHLMTVNGNPAMCECGETSGGHSPIDRDNGKYFPFSDTRGCKQFTLIESQFKETLVDATTCWTRCNNAKCTENANTVVPIKDQKGYTCPFCGQLTSKGNVGPYKLAGSVSQSDNTATKTATPKMSTKHEEAIRLLLSINTGLLGYEKVTKAMAVCAVAGENFMLLGSRGGAKSTQVRLFFRHFEGQKFEAQFSKFADESVLFGNPDVKEMKESGKIVYPKDQGLAAAHWALFDEFPDGNWMLHRACNAPLNERKVIRGNDGGFDIPLNMVVATGNYAMQSDEKMEAVIDRFAFYALSPKLSPAEREHLYNGHNFENPALPAKAISLDALQELRKMAESVKIPKALAVAFIAFADQQGFSPRRERKMSKILKVHALLHGRQTVGVDDIAILEYILPFTKITAAQGENPAAAMAENIKRAAVVEEQLTLIDNIKKTVDPSTRKDTYAKALAKAIKQLRAISPADQRCSDYHKNVVDSLMAEHQAALQALELIV